MNVFLSFLSTDDISGAVAVATTCFGDRIKDDAFVHFVTTFHFGTHIPRTFVARDLDKNKQVVGIVQSLPASIHPRIQSFSWLSVLPDYRRKGIATALIQYAEKDTITNFFGDLPGSFILVSGIEPAFYEKIGYYGNTKTYDNLPIMSKHYIPPAT